MVFKSAAWRSGFRVAFTTTLGVITGCSLSGLRAPKLLGKKFFFANAFFGITGFSELANSLGKQREKMSSLSYRATISYTTTKKQCPAWPTGREIMTTSSCWVRGYNSTPSPTVQSTPVNRTVERDSAVSGY